MIAREGGIALLVGLLRDGHENTRGCAVRVLRALVNVSLWYDQEIEIALEAGKKKEGDHQIKSDSQDILSHWQKKPELVFVTQGVWTQKRSLTGSPVSSHTSFDHLSSPSEASIQSLALPAIEVYEAMYQYQKVGVKKYVGAQLRSHDRTGIMAEIALMASLKHQYFVAFLGVIVVWLLGGASRHFLGLAVAEELVQGLASLHEKNVVHRDIKSLDVVLEEELHAKWCDFGLAVLKQHATSIQSHREQAVGAAQWMAPDLFEDEPVVSRKADI